MKGGEIVILISGSHSSWCSRVFIFLNVYGGRQASELIGIVHGQVDIELEYWDFLLFRSVYSLGGHNPKGRKIDCLR